MLLMCTLLCARLCNFKCCMLVVANISEHPLCVAEASPVRPMMTPMAPMGAPAAAQVRLTFSSCSIASAHSASESKDRAEVALLSCHLQHCKAELHNRILPP